MRCGSSARVASSPFPATRDGSRRSSTFPEKRTSLSAKRTTWTGRLPCTWTTQR
jgi:hypothetical protein